MQCTQALWASSICSAFYLPLPFYRFRCPIYPCPNVVQRQITYNHPQKCPTRTRAQNKQESPISQLDNQCQVVLAGVYRMLREETWKENERKRGEGGRKERKRRDVKREKGERDVTFIYLSIYLSIYRQRHMLDFRPPPCPVDYHDPTCLHHERRCSVNAHDVHRQRQRRYSRNPPLSNGRA